MKNSIWSETKIGVLGIGILARIELPEETYQLTLMKSLEILSNTSLACALPGQCRHEPEKQLKLNTLT